ncbi:hypothetical protein K3G63_22450, partial [Hymenobacter sp. HSC-4F20]|uniref:hypothetical protein n=1 Tax=Hymenobacter sp. HSC-4F20 TaxID=2864135 RepID=UPI001C72D42A
VTDELPAVLKPGKREKIITEVAKLTAYGKGTSHLMRMSEFFSMYLFAWSNVLWPTKTSAGGATVLDLPTFNDVYPNEPAATTKVVGKADQIVVSKTPLGESYDNEAVALISFYSTLGKVRRALANIPSYMMCDDHEITDDWFLNLEWVERAYSSSLGTKIIQNGMVAFAVFQSWGNTPARFNADTPGGDLLTKLQQVHSARGDAMSVKWNEIGNIILPKISYDGRGPNNTPMKSLETNFGIDYHFSIVFNKFILIALDSRTHRQFTDIDSPAKPPALLSYSALTNQVNTPLNSLPASVEVALVLCPAPMFGHSIVEGIVQELVAGIDDAPFHLFSTKATDGHPISGNENQDKEAWAFNEDGMQGALREFSKYKRVVFFSGDVHYGFSVNVDYHRPAISNPSNTNLPVRAHFTQLVCSSLKNQDSKTRLSGTLASQAMTLLDRATLMYAGWSLPVPNPHVMQHDKQELHGIPVYRHEAPVVIRMTDERYYKDAQGDYPQWEYSLQFALDKRNKSVRFPNAPVFTWTTNTLDKVKQISVEHMKYGNNRVGVGEDQIGDVTFSWDSSSKSVKQSFWYKSHGNPSQVDPFNHTVHTVVLPSF